MLEVTVEVISSLREGNQQTHFSQDIHKCNYYWYYSQPRPSPQHYTAVLETDSV